MLVERFPCSIICCWAVLLVLLGGAACSSSSLTTSSEASEPRQGNAFGDLQPSEIAFNGKPAYAVGQESVLMYVQIRNVSDRELEVARIDPVESSPSGVVDVVAIYLGPRMGDGLPGGPYSTKPPVLDVGEAGREKPRCVDQPLIPADGAKLPGGDDTTYMVAIHVNPIRPGTWTLDHLRVMYSQENDVLYQDIPFRVVMPIDEAPGRPIPDDQRVCATPETQLPGWE
jgi:hypothetical protein